MTIQEQLIIADGHRFQDKLAHLIISRNLKSVVEIGSGVSSLFILDAFDRAGIDGVLYSIDPAPWYPYKIEHPLYHQINGTSIDCLVEVFNTIGAADLYLSDGCHEIKDMTYEYWFIYGCMKPGGYLVADDTTFGNNGAWENFLKKFNLKDDVFGDARIIQKPETDVVVSDIYSHHLSCLDIANNAESEWLSKGNKLSNIQWYRL